MPYLTVKKSIEDTKFTSLNDVDSNEFYIHVEVGSTHINYSGVPFYTHFFFLNLASVRGDHIEHIIVGFIARIGSKINIYPCMR